MSKKVKFLLCFLDNNRQRSWRDVVLPEFHSRSAKQKPNSCDYHPEKFEDNVQKQTNKHDIKKKTSGSALLLLCGNFGETGRAVIIAHARAHCWPPSVSQQPRLPRGFYREWQCRIKYSLPPPLLAVRWAEADSIVFSCAPSPPPFPSLPGLFTSVHKIKTTKGSRRPAREKLCLLISPARADVAISQTALNVEQRCQ